MSSYNDVKAQAVTAFCKANNNRYSEREISESWKPHHIRQVLCRDFFSFNTQAEQELAAPGNSKVFWETVQQWSEKALEKQQAQAQVHQKIEIHESKENNEGNKDDDKELTPVATGYMHEGQAYYEVWQGEECLDGGLLFWMGEEERQELDPAFGAFCQALEQSDEDLILSMLCALADLPETSPSYFISWYCLAFHLKTTFNLIGRCYCRMSISCLEPETREYFSERHIQAQEYSFKTSGLIPEALIICGDSFSSDDDNFFFKFIELTQVISHSVDLSFIDGFAGDFHNLFIVDVDNGRPAIYGSIAS